MSKRFVYAPCGIGAARLILASVGTTVMIFDEYFIRMRLFGAIVVSDARFQLIVSESSRRVEDLFKRLEIYVHTRAIYVVFDGKTSMTNVASCWDHGRPPGLECTIFVMLRFDLVAMMVHFNLATQCTCQGLISFDSIFVLTTVDQEPGRK